jgi:hypothetical protein
MEASFEAKAVSRLYLARLPLRAIWAVSLAWTIALYEPIIPEDRITKRSEKLSGCGNHGTVRFRTVDRDLLNDDFRQRRRRRSDRRSYAHAIAAGT